MRRRLSSFSKFLVSCFEVRSYSGQNENKYDGKKDIKKVSEATIEKQ